MRSATFSKTSTEEINFEDVRESNRSIENRIRCATIASGNRDRDEKEPNDSRKRRLRRTKTYDGARWRGANTTRGFLRNTTGVTFKTPSIRTSSRALRRLILFHLLVVQPVRQLSSAAGRTRPVDSRDRFSVIDARADLQLCLSSCLVLPFFCAFIVVDRTVLAC